MAKIGGAGATGGVQWRVALAQHPMYLLIKEDTECAERTPPWGEPTIEGYIARVRGAFGPA